MKDYLFSLLTTIFLSACVNNSTPNNETAITSPCVIANLVDSIITVNPDYLNNDIKRKKVAKEIQTTILSAVNNEHSVLTEIPLAFEQMMHKGNKYIVKFELANLGSNGTRISDKYDIYLTYLPK